MNIHNPSIKKILMRAGVVRIKRDTYDEIRNVIREYLYKTLIPVCDILRYKNTHTLSIDILETSIELGGGYIGAGVNKAKVAVKDDDGNPKTVIKEVMQTDGTKIKKRYILKKQATTKSLESCHYDRGTKPKTKKRHAPGSVATKEVKKITDRSDCLIIPKATFKREVVEVMSMLDFTEPRFNSSALDLLQLVVEEYAIKVTILSKILAEQADRVSVSAKDVVLSKKINDGL